MRREYDLTYDLGKSNWIDSVAGEAVVVGHAVNDPVLVAEGTQLSGMIREIKFDDDKFCLVEARAMHLIAKLDAIKDEEKTCLFIDEIFEGDPKSKLLNRWEYDLIYCGGRYEVRMVLPRYTYGERVKEEREPVSELLRDCFFDFDDNRFEKEIHDYKTQIFELYKFYDTNRNLICRVVDHDHEGGMFRGWLEVYYFDDFGKAWAAWNKVKSYKNK